MPSWYGLIVDCQRFPAFFLCSGIVRAHVCLCVFIQVRITAQPGPVIYSFYATSCNPPEGYFPSTYSWLEMRMHPAATPLPTTTTLGRNPTPWTSTNNTTLCPEKCLCVLVSCTCLRLFFLFLFFSPTGDGPQRARLPIPTYCNVAILPVGTRCTKDLPLSPRMFYRNDVMMQRQPSSTCGSHAFPLRTQELKS